MARRGKEEWQITTMIPALQYGIILLARVDMKIPNPSTNHRIGKYCFFIIFISIIYVNSSQQPERSSFENCLCSAVDIEFRVYATSMCFHGV